MLKILENYKLRKLSKEFKQETLKYTSQIHACREEGRRTQWKEMKKQPDAIREHFFEKIYPYIIKMKRSYIYIIMSVILVGCSNSKMEFKQEPLTGQGYWLASINLLPMKNIEKGSLILKCDKDDFIEKNPIKATLKMDQKGKEYNINSHETLKVYIDGTPLALPLVNSFQEPVEEVSQYPVAMPSGRSLMLGTVREVTRRNMSFFISFDDLSKMIAAKKIVFEITSSSSKDSLPLQKYPIVLDLRTEDIPFLQEFKSSCVKKP